MRSASARVLLTTLLILSIAVTPGSLTHAAPLPEPTVVPPLIEEERAPGESLLIDKEVHTSAIPPRPDVVLVVDGTDSMAPAIDDVQQNLNDITSAVRAEQPDSRFAVATYGDHQVDGDRTFEVFQDLTHDLADVQAGVDQLTADRGGFSDGPAEDWINALWQVATGAAGSFRENATPMVVLIGDASSHDPSVGHTLSDAISALHDTRVIAIDLETDIGDGLNGDREVDWSDVPSHQDQATTIVEATDGTLLSGINEDEVAEAIVDGLTNLPTTVSYETVTCDDFLTITLEPVSQTVTSGTTATMEESVHVADDAPQGTTRQCVLQFLLDGEAPEDHGTGPVPDYQQHINVTVADVEGPIVTVDDRIARADDEDGVRIEFTATAEDAVDGELPVSCDPGSGAVFPVGSTEVRCTATDSAGNEGADTAVFTVLEPEAPEPPPRPEPPPPPEPPSADIAVTVNAEPEVSHTGRPTEVSFTLTNAGPDTAEDVVLTTAWPLPDDTDDLTVHGATRCTPEESCTLAAGQRLEVTQTGVYASPLTGTVAGQVNGGVADPAPANNTDRAPISVLQPKLEVTPEVATPGQVVVARGQDFPAHTTVALSWDTGITTARSPVRVDRDGSFEAQVLIVRKDQVGPRLLRADVAGYDRLDEPVLVVQRTLQPPDFAGRG